MSAFVLRLDKIKFTNDVDRDAFLSAPNANILPKLFYYFLEQGTRWGKSNVSNRHLQNILGSASERAVQYNLQQLDDLGFITIEYEKDRPSKLISEYSDAQKVGKRTGITIHLDQMIEYTNLSRYDDQYKQAQKRGWLRRLINQLPIQIVGMFKHAIAMAKKAHNDAKLEELHKRQENYDRHVKRSLKRHRSYMALNEINTADVDLLECAEIIAMIGTKDLPGILIIPPSAAIN